MTSSFRPLRILHLVSSDRWTGVAEPAVLLAVEQICQGHHVEFACRAGGGFETRLVNLGVPFCRGLRFGQNLTPWADVRRLSHLLSWHSFDIVHCHLPHAHWLAAATLRRPFTRVGKGDAAPGPALVRTIHRETPPRHDPAHRWLLGKGCDLVITVSSSQRRRVIERVGVPPVKVVRIPGAVDLERFRPDLDGAAMRRTYHIPPRARVAGMVARMRKGRGHHRLLDTAESVAAAEPRAVLALAGRGALKFELIDRIKNHPLAGHLRRIGYRSDDLELIYASFDVAVQLAPGTDGSCRAMLEAMACGRPVIGTRVGAIADTIEPGVNGWLCRPDDREALARALIEALGHDERTRDMGAAARRHVETHHRRSAQCQATIEVYREALARRAR